MIHGRDMEAAFRSIACLASLLTLSCAASAADYFVAPNGNDSNNGTSVSSPWRTIAKANDRARAGDTVYLRGGEYLDDPIAPISSGQSGKPITFTSYQGERPVLSSDKVAGLRSAISLSDVSYIVVRKIVANGRQPFPAATIKFFARLENAAYVEIIDCEFQYAEGWDGIDIMGTSHHNRLVRNRVDFVGAYDKDGNDYGDAITIAKDAHNNLVASNYVTRAGHDLIRTPGYNNIVQDNVFDNDWSEVVGADRGGRNLTIDGTNNVFQRNIVRHASRSVDAPYNAGMKVEGTGNIIRHNVLHDNHHDAIQTETGSWQEYSRDLRIYNNTIYNNGGAAWRVRFFENENWPTGNVFKNNLVYKNRQAPSSTVDDADFRIILTDAGVDAPAGNYVVNNLVAKAAANDAKIYLTPPSAHVALETAEADYTEIGNNIQAVPAFVKSQPASFADFELAAGSPGIDAAAPLTTTKAAAFGSTIDVVDASYFSDGYGLAPGDLISVGAERIVRVLRVDLAANRLSVDREISWAAGAPVQLEYSGTAPDIGAVEAGHASQLASRPKSPVLTGRSISN